MTRALTLICFVLLVIAVSVVTAAASDDVEVRKQQARRARRQKLDQRTKNGARLAKDQIVHALDIAYPLKLFESERSFDWRQHASFSSQLHDFSAGGEYQEYVFF